METRIGLGYRRDLSDEFTDRTVRPDFIELAPENWIDLGGFWGKKLREVAEMYPIFCHGLSLSIGSPEPLNWDFIKKLKVFLDTYNVALYSEHLSYTKSGNAHLYDLLPIPFREDAVNHISQRIREVQDFLERPLILENVSYYTPVAAEMTELAFVNAIVEQSGCHLLLDVNNVYVNAFNHQYDGKAYIEGLPLDKVAYIHMAGHEQVSDDLIIDTHGSEIIDPVYDLFEWTIQKLTPVPVLLERDFNFPEEGAVLQEELNRLKEICNRQWQ